MNGGCLNSQRSLIKKRVVAEGEFEKKRLLKGA